MSRRAKLSDRPEVAKHLHDHFLVTRAELDTFVSEEDAVQLLVLAELRSRTADQETSLLLTLQAAAIAVVAVMFSRIPADAVAQPSSAGPEWLKPVILSIACLVIGALAVGVLLPSIRNAVRGNNDRARATVWLAAYEQALAGCRANAPARPRRQRSRR